MEQSLIRSILTAGVCVTALSLGACHSGSRKASGTQQSSTRPAASTAPAHPVAASSSTAATGSSSAPASTSASASTPAKTTGGIERVLYSFAGESGGAFDGAGPTGSLVQGPDGNLYGMTWGGGVKNIGTIFKITTAGAETVLHSFDEADGMYPYGSLVLGPDGNLYGMTYQGGVHNLGVVFKITTAGVETVLHSFGPDDGRPTSSLMLGSDGNFYGTAQLGGANNGGVVFKITTAGVETVLHSFGGEGDGANPMGRLIQGRDGNLYGTTSMGGDKGRGTVFKITTAGVETVLHSFAGGADGKGPNGRLIQGPDGNLYGMTSAGLASPVGDKNNGTVFKITTAGVETVLHTFSGGADGKFPNGSLILGRDGNLYGLTSHGGDKNEDGVVFKITTTGAETVLYSFVGGNDGRVPMGSLIQGKDGSFYGMTQYGGRHSFGTVFELKID